MAWAHPRLACPPSSPQVPHPHSHPHEPNLHTRRTHSGGLLVGGSHANVELNVVDTGESRVLRHSRPAKVDGGWVRVVLYDNNEASKFGAIPPPPLASFRCFFFSLFYLRIMFTSASTCTSIALHLHLHLHRHISSPPSPVFPPPPPSPPPPSPPPPSPPPPSPPPPPHHARLHLRLHLHLHLHLRLVMPVSISTSTCISTCISTSTSRAVCRPPYPDRVHSRKNPSTATFLCGR